MPSHIENETMAIMLSEPHGAAMRKACEEFERFWESGVKNQPRGRFINVEIEEQCKKIARMAWLEARGL